MRNGHKQVWVRVNAPVDSGVARIVELLNSIPKLQTVDSCQGIPGQKLAHVYFYYGDWKRISRFVFHKLRPIGKCASVEVFNGSLPLGKLSFEMKATTKVASILQRALQERP